MRFRTDGSSAPTVDDKGAEGTVEELPLGLIGLVFAAPGTSVFSNFEVFVAKRRVANDHLELMKLVYEFLPYQRRLSEYNLNNLPPRVIKNLRIIPIPAATNRSGRPASLTPIRSPTHEAPKLPAAFSAFLPIRTLCSRVIARRQIISNEQWRPATERPQAEKTVSYQGIALAIP